MKNVGLDSKRVYEIPSKGKTREITKKDIIEDLFRGRFTTTGGACKKRTPVVVPEDHPEPPTEVVDHVRTREEFNERAKDVEHSVVPTLGDRCADIVFQPYNVSFEAIEKLVEFCDFFGLDCAIMGSSEHDPCCLTVEVYDLDETPVSELYEKSKEVKYA